LVFSTCFSSSDGLAILTQPLARKVALYVFDRSEVWGMITGKWGGRLHCRTRVSTSELEAVLVACEGRYVGLECKSARDNVLVYFSKLDEEWQQNSTVLVDELVRMHEDQTEQEISPQQVASKDLAHTCAPCWHLSCPMK